MPPDSKSPKGPKKGTKQHRPTAKEAALKYSDSEEEGGSSSSSNSSSKSKNRQPVKPRQKSSSTKGSGSNPSAVVKHPKSRPNLILSKKTKSLMKQQQQAQAHKAQQAQQKGGRNSPELKKTSPKSKAPKSKSRSGKVSGGGSSGGGGGSRSSSGLSCSKSVGPKGTTTSKSPGGHSKQQLHQAKTSVETVGSVQKTGGGGGGGNTIIFLGSPSDPAALELLKNLVKQINPSTSEAKQQQQPQQPTSASTTTTKTTTQTGSPEDQTVVTDQTQLEEVYDAMYDLANNVKTIHDSYEKIVASLVNLQHRRSKTKKEGKGTVEKGGTLIPAATKSATSASSDGSEDAPTPPTPPATPTTTPTDPTDISRFMDARTRADAFAELFATVETLKEAMTPFNGCFNEGGFFQAATYAAETGRQITVGQRAAWLVQIRALNVTVEKLLAEYNREVLDMFRLVSSSGG